MKRSGMRTNKSKFEVEGSRLPGSRKKVVTDKKLRKYMKYNMLVFPWIEDGSFKVNDPF